MTTIRDATPEDFAPVLDLWRQDAEASATDDEAALRIVLVLGDADRAAAFWEQAGYGLDARMRRHAAPGQC